MPQSRKHFALIPVNRGLKIHPFSRKAQNSAFRRANQPVYLPDRHGSSSWKQTIFTDRYATE
jgi:hypothetical protein